MVETERGFSVSYQNRLLYSKYAPDKAVLGAIGSMDILPCSLIVACSPVLWLGLKELLLKAGDSCFVLGVEFDENLHEFARTTLEKMRDSDGGLMKNAALLPFDKNEFIVNILSGENVRPCPARKDSDDEKSAGGDTFTVPPIYNFRRAIMIEMSAGTQFHKDEYLKSAMLAQNAIASFWKNRVTLTKLGRLFSRNLLRNLAALPCSADLKNLCRKTASPIFVFGAGESVEETIQNVPKNLLERCFVIAVDAAAPVLESYGVRIDAVCAVEGQVAIEKAYIGGAAKNALLIADMTSRPQVTRHAKKVACFASKYADSSFFRSLSGNEWFPPVVPPLGSVGLTAVYVSLMLRESASVPVFLSGLDFSFSTGRTHARSAPAHTARLCSSGRLNPAENYAASFRAGAKQIIGKNGIQVRTDTALENYARSFADAFAGVQNLYDAGRQGIPLGVQEISSEKLAMYLETVGQKERQALIGAGAEKSQIVRYLEGEEKALNRIKELLMFGQDVASCGVPPERELHSLISEREYLFLHFPDGYRCSTGDLSFLKRIRGQIDFFLKDIKLALGFLSAD